MFQQLGDASAGEFRKNDGDGSEGLVGVALSVAVDGSWFEKVDERSSEFWRESENESKVRVGVWTSNRADGNPLIGVLECDGRGDGVKSAWNPGTDGSGEASDKMWLLAGGARPCADGCTGVCCMLCCRAT